MDAVKPPTVYAVMPDLMKDEQIAEYVRAARRGEIRNVDLVADLETRALPSSVEAAVAAELAKPIEYETYRVGRNHLCPCKSGRKFKKCCQGYTRRV